MPRVLKKVAIPEEIQSAYREHVASFIQNRLKYVIPIGIILHVSFNVFDYRLYPEYGSLFLKIRIVDSLVMALMWVKNSKRENRFSAVKYFAVTYLIVAAGLAVMVAVHVGVKGHYHEGFNIVILALLFVNNFHLSINLMLSMLVWIFYVIGALLNPYQWDAWGFFFANYFISATVLFVLFVTHFYSSQHRELFIKNAQMENQEKILKKLYQVVDLQAKTDDLTKIYNRRYFSEVFDRKIKESKLTNRGFYIVIFDIDNFKQINDRYGHLVGDQVIIRVSQIVQSLTRKGNLLGRYGGDEFIMIIDEAQEASLRRRLEEIRDAVRQEKFCAKGETFSLSSSFGASWFDPQSDLQSQEIIELSDKALLDVKNTCRGEIKIISST